MTIYLPKNLERSVRALVRGGRFDSVDDAMAAAARLLLQQQSSAKKLITGAEQVSRPPNAALLAALEEVDGIQQGMHPKKGRSSQDYLEEARSGAMYDYGGDDSDPGCD